jgi:hypothetical protein
MKVDFYSLVKRRKHTTNTKICLAVNQALPFRYLGVPIHYKKNLRTGNGNPCKTALTKWHVG